MKSIHFHNIHIHSPLIILLLLLTSGLLACGQQHQSSPMNNNNKSMENKSNKTNDDWRKLLTPVQFNVLREKGTERAFTGQYDDFFDDGTYYCAACGAKLFTSSAKYNSGCGWPAFFEPADSANMLFRKDLSYGMVRTEVLCARCGGHLGHIFDDGPKPTGQRYCINSVSLQFVKKGGKPPELR
jgi:peptide-methionine (R)-S-oxide reductase